MTRRTVDPDALEHEVRHVRQYCVPKWRRPDGPLEEAAWEARVIATARGRLREVNTDV